MDAYRWFNGVYWAEKRTYIDCLVDLNTSQPAELDDGMWLISDKDQLMLRRAGETGVCLVLGKAVRWGRAL